MVFTFALMDFIPIPIQQYAEQHTSPSDALLQRIERETHLHVLKSRMLSGHLQGRFLAMISRMIQPRWILEIGTYTGYSALCMAEGLHPDGKLYTLEVSEELGFRAQRYFDESGFKSQIELRIGDAADLIPNLVHEWDLVFIDADKASYRLYYELVLPQLRAGGVILVDNVLWSGKVADEEMQDPATKTIREFNNFVQQDPRVENILLTVRDGLMIVRKK